MEVEKEEEENKKEDSVPTAGHLAVHNKEFHKRIGRQRNHLSRQEGPNIPLEPTDTSVWDQVLKFLQIQSLTKYYNNSNH